MEIQATFCHNQDESARYLSPPPSRQSPLDWLSGQLDDVDWPFQLKREIGSIG